MNQKSVVVADESSSEDVERKWKVLQPIWSEYLASSKADEFFVLISKLATNGETIHSLQNILTGFNRNGCFQYFRGRKNYKFFEVNHRRLVGIYKSIRSAWIFNTGIYRCGNLELNLQESYIQYKDNPTVDISSENNEIKFLTLLMQKPGIMRRYINIARELEINSATKDASNADTAREVQYLKRDLRPILIGAGLTEMDIDQMIVAKTNVGYKLVPPGSSQDSH